MSRASVLAVLAVLAASLVLALVEFVPHVKSRAVSTGTPVPQPVLRFAFFSVPQRASACLDRVAVEPGDQVALFDVDPAAGPALRFTIRGTAYEQEHQIPAGYTDGHLVVPFNGPRSSQLTTVCIRNLGGGEVRLRGTNELRTLSRPRMTIEGVPTAGEFSLAFRSTDDRSAFEVVGTIARRISAFKPMWVQPWSVIALLALVLCGAFAGPLVALWRSFVLDERQ